MAPDPDFFCNSPFGSWGCLQSNFDNGARRHFNDAMPQLTRRPFHHTSYAQSSNDYSDGDSEQEAYEQDPTEGFEEASQRGYMSDDSAKDRSAGRVKRSWKSALSRFSSSNRQK
ncbi:uncharacterized protein N7483_005907 [Penicillium malachiteum]|uniref:uncharacterized protein n=1 Tax=Penicillium malachiteum TaxID=1324776 RepID=UPI002547CBF9|nr:uncharacterized protein N7483_005907 [Penicillium malachiteum]KAJ5731399.1 hypothetical protein N7483_005907 [Penicillium malachiteum]